MSKTPEDLVDKFIDELLDIFNPTGADDLNDNFAHHEYYFRVKLYNQKHSPETLRELVNYYKHSLADAGDAVGMKAALAVGEALTQAPLKAIHKGGGGVSRDVLQRPKGIDRFQEILSGLPNKDCVITIKLRDDSKENTERFANDNETFFFKEVWKRLETCVCSSIEKKIRDLHPRIDFSTININSKYLKMVIELSEISAFDIHVADITEALTNNFPEIYFITGYILNTTEFMAYIFIKPTISDSKIQKMIFDFSQERSQGIIHGKYLKRCFITENKNDPGHYVMQANEVREGVLAIENMIYNPDIDPTGCRITDLERSLNIFGLNETLARLHEEIVYTSVNLSETKELLFRHYKTMVDCMLSNGNFKFAKRNTLKADATTDIMKLVSFETAPDMLKTCLRSARFQPVIDAVAASVFGDLATIGSGVSKISLYKDSGK